MTGQQHQIGKLREHLFNALEELRDAEKPVDRERVELVVAVSKEIIATGKLEVDAMRVSGASRGTGFLPEPVGDDELTPSLRRRLVAARQRDAGTQ